MGRRGRRGVGWGTGQSTLSGPPLKPPPVSADRLSGPPADPFDLAGRFAVAPPPPAPADATDPGEAAYVCDACGEEIVVPVDAAAGAEQEYVEDCPVCCRPNVIHVDVDSGGDVRVSAAAEQDFE